MSAVEFPSVREHLQEFNSRFLLAVDGFDSNVRDLLIPFLSDSGKRIRPTLVFLCGGLTNNIDSEVLHLYSTVTEMIHTASLLHDDVIDAAIVRRKKPTFNSLWGNDLAVLAGDLLYIHALSLMTNEAVDLRNAVHSTVKAMSEAEILQGLLKYKRPTLDQYFRVISGKTASLIALACKLGSTSVNSVSSHSVFQTIGNNMGIAFQIIDDLLDWTSDSDFGKSKYQDLKDGRITLPLLKLFDKLPEVEVEKILDKIQPQNDLSVQKTGDYLLSLMVCNEIPKLVLATAEDLIRKNIQLLNEFDDTTFKRDLISLNQLVIRRNV